MVLGRKTNCFLGKTKKTKKNKKTIFWETMWPNSKKIVFLVFPQEKVGFSAQNHLFPRKKLVLDRKTIFFLGKSWFWTEKPTFS